MFYVGGDEWFWEVVRDNAGELGAEFHKLDGFDHAQAFASSDVVCPLVEDFLQRAES